jgi:CheY-like chemotaxis protein
MDKKFSFIVIDDSELDCFVTQKFLEHADKNLVVKTFQDAHDVLEMIRGNIVGDDLLPAIILLDLQMPVMNGFRFAEEFERFPPEVKKDYKIIILTILSSTGNPNELYKILNYPEVHTIIEKPLTIEKLSSLLMYLNSGALLK